MVDKKTVQVSYTYHPDRSRDEDRWRSMSIFYMKKFANLNDNRGWAYWSMA